MTKIVMNYWMISQSDTDDVENTTDKPLNGAKEKNWKRSSHKVNGGNKSQVTTILGDSLISKIEGYRVSKKLNNTKHVVVNKLNACLIT